MSEIEGSDYIDGVVEKKLNKHLDSRGHLIETFRIDELPKDINPVMSYVSITQPGYWRGPHLHKERTEIFAFPGPGNFRIVLWDDRKESDMYLKRKIIFAGEDSPILLVIPPGIVHVVENISKLKDALLINYPNTLFKGYGRHEVFTDEIRFENDESIFWKDFLEIRNT